MRVLEGAREGAASTTKPVTSSFLKFMNFANYELEEDVQTEDQIRKVYSLKDLGLLTEASLSWTKSARDEKASHVFRINGQEYSLTITPGRLPERNQFRIEVDEQSAAGRTSLLDTEFSLPQRSAAVFGFETTELKPYFIVLRVASWVGEPAAPGDEAAAGTAGAVAGGVVRAGVDRIKPPKLIREVKPDYPEMARRAQVQGVVILEATTDTYGRVDSIKVLRSIPLLDQAAVDALKQWVYEPMVIDGKPMPVVFTVTMRFTLDADKRAEVGGVVGGVAGGVEGGVAGGVEGGSSQALEKFAAGATIAIKDVKPPRLVKEVRPVYPEIARQAKVQGAVILAVKTDEHGRVANVIVLRSIPLLDQAAIDAVRQWVYEPFVQDGKAAPVVFTVTVRFQLK
jgi:TonB family protein